MTADPSLEKLWNAAFRLAAKKPWRDITLSQIATEADLSLAGTAALVSSKTELLQAFARHIDHQLLTSLETDPLEGEIHDRLFDAMLRRLELLTPYKEAIRSIAADPAENPFERLSLACSAIASQTWIMTAAGLEKPGLFSELGKLVLARINREVLHIWIDDDDRGLARTMAALDRKLRDAAALARRFETPMAVLSGLAKAARAFQETQRNQRRPTSDATAD